MDFNVIIERATRAIKADATVFPEVGADEPHTSSTAVLVAIIGGVSGLLNGLFTRNLVSGLIGGIVGAFLAWVIGTGIFYLLGKAFGGEGDYMTLLRGNAYAATPGIAAGIPVIGPLLGLYSLWLYILNVRENMSLSTGAAAAVVLIPAAVVLVLAFILIAVIGIALLGSAT